MKQLVIALPLAIALAACGSNAGNQSGNGAGSSGVQVTGAGSTFVYPVLSAWAADYRKQSGTAINYQSIGSGAGVAQVKAGTVDFGATDQPLASDELAQGKLVQFPIVVGGIVAVVNIPGLSAGQLKLTGPVLADIYAGKVKSWNDPVLTRLNPGLKLPAAAVAVVHRSDGSGTSFNFTHYLSQVSPTWKSGPGEGKSVSWPVGVGGKGNEGVAGYVKQIPNSIGYVEYAYAKQNKLTYTALINKAGKTIQPTNEAFQAAAANADWPSAPGYYLILTDQPGDKSWPIVASTFILIHKEAVDKAASQEALKFFKFAFDKGAKSAEELDYIPMPDNVIKLIEKTWNSEIKS